MKYVFALVGFLTAMSTTQVALATDTGDLYPSLPVSEARVRPEYVAASEAFDEGDRDASHVLAALTPGQLTCTYYMTNYRRKEDAPLVVSNGRIGRNSRSLTVFGSRVQLMTPRSASEGPWLNAEVQGVKYHLQVRLGSGDAEGSVIISVEARTGVIGLDRPQYLVCNSAN